MIVSIDDDMTQRFNAGSAGGMGRLALVTGGAARVGRVIVQALVCDGWSVVVHANSSIADARRLADELTSAAAPVYAIQGDLAEARAVTGLVDDAVHAAGRLPDLLVNNASVFEFDDAASQTPENWDRQMAVNATAPMMLSRRYFNLIARSSPDGATADGGKAGATGAIVNILDTKIFNPDGRFLSYEISKATLAAITRSTAEAYAPYVTVNAIAPGLTLPSGKQTEAQFREVHGLNPLGVGATPDQIARAVIMFATTPSLTGQILAIDGGEGLTRPDPRVFQAM